ncbi:MAG: triosephosphate isomerase [Candidatus Vogelbacteria bacterium]|nr:triosephosphate isomerase [Candidatus Vogelbacteria bacterium]
MAPETPREARRLFGKVKRAAGRLRRTAVVICPPAVFLPLFKPGPNLALGGQDIFEAARGAYTGSISAAQIKYAGAEYTIIGHSERRARGETDELINRKIKLAGKIGLRTILAVGETERDERGDYLRTLREMLERDLDRVSRAAVEALIIVYEPAWAIGGAADAADTPENFLEHSLFIRKVLAARFGQNSAMLVPILYGGSVTPENAADFLGRGEAAGLLVGHESLSADRFSTILRLADRSLTYGSGQK